MVDEWRPHLGETIAASDSASYGDVLLALGPTQYQPLFFFIGNAIFRTTGHDPELLLKLFNLLLLLVSIGGLLRLFRHWDPAHKLYLAGLFAFNGYLIQNVLQIREYPLYLALVIWSTAFYFDLFENDAAKPPTRFWLCWIAYVSTGILGFYAHAFFVFLLAAQAIFVFWRSSGTKLVAMRIYAALAVIGAAALPWILFLNERFPWRMDPGNFTAGKPQTVAYLLECFRIGFRDMLIYHDSQRQSLNLDRPEFLRMFLDSYAILLGLGVFLALLSVSRRLREIDPRIPFSVLTLFVFLGYQATYFFWKDTMSTWERYFIGNYFGTIVLGAFAFRRFEEHLRTRTALLRRAGLTVAIGGTFLASAGQLYNYARWPFLDTPLTPECSWEEIGTKLSQYVRPGDTVLNYHPLQGWTLSPSFKTPVKEANFWATKAGAVPDTQVVWLLDTHVTIDARDEAIAVLEKTDFAGVPWSS